MAPRGTANYFEAERVAGDPSECELVNTPIRFAGLQLSALWSRSARSFWASDADWSNGLDGIYLAMRGLLMPCGEDIIREVREARGPLIPGTDSTLDAYPVGDYPGYTLGDVSRRLGNGGPSINERLQEANVTLAQIRDNLAAQGQLDDDILAELVKIAALLAV